MHELDLDKQHCGSSSDASATLFNEVFDSQYGSSSKKSEESSSAPDGFSLIDTAQLRLLNSSWLIGQGIGDNVTLTGSTPASRSSSESTSGPVQPRSGDQCNPANLRTTHGDGSPGPGHRKQDKHDAPENSFKREFGLNELTYGEMPRIIYRETDASNGDGSVPPTRRFHRDGDGSMPPIGFNGRGENFQSPSITNARINP